MRHALLAMLVVVAACRDAQPPLPTSDEAEQLNEAEEMLNAEAEQEQR